MPFKAALALALCLVFQSCVGLEIHGAQRAKWEDVQGTLRTGDLALWGHHSLVDEDAETPSGPSHVGLVVRIPSLNDLFLMEPVIYHHQHIADNWENEVSERFGIDLPVHWGGAVRLIPMASHIRKETQDGSLAIRRLSLPGENQELWETQHVAPLREFWQRFEELPHGVTLQDHGKHPALEGAFSARVIAAALQHLGVLPSEPHARAFSIEHFLDSRHDGIASLLPYSRVTISVIPKRRHGITPAPSFLEIQDRVRSHAHAQAQAHTQAQTQSQAQTETRFDELPALANVMPSTRQMLVGPLAPIPGESEEEMWKRLRNRLEELKALKLKRRTGLAGDDQALFNSLVIVFQLKESEAMHKQRIDKIPNICNPNVCDSRLHSEMLQIPIHGISLPSDQEQSWFQNLKHKFIKVDPLLIFSQLPRSMDMKMQGKWADQVVSSNLTLHPYGKDTPAHRPVNHLICMCIFKPAPKLPRDPQAATNEDFSWNTSPEILHAPSDSGVPSAFKAHERTAFDVIAPSLRIIMKDKKLLGKDDLVGGYLISFEAIRNDIYYGDLMVFPMNRIYDEPTKSQITDISTGYKLLCTPKFIPVTAECSQDCPDKKLQEDNTHRFYANWVKDARTADVLLLRSSWWLEKPLMATFAIPVTHAAVVWLDEHYQFMLIFHSTELGVHIQSLRHVVFCGAYEMVLMRFTAWRTGGSFASQD